MRIFEENLYLILLIDFRHSNRILAQLQARPVPRITLSTGAADGAGKSPNIAGMYALAAQVKSDIAAKEFWPTAIETGRTNELKHGNKHIPFGPILTQLH
jgi:hypothetical protein